MGVLLVADMVELAGVVVVIGGVFASSRARRLPMSISVLLVELAPRSS